jgi:GT2 family glycosyltransferase
VAHEVLVVDQSVADDTEQIVQAITGEHPTVRYLRLTEKGLSRAYNAGVRETTADLVAFTDDDCVASEYWLHKIRRSFEEEPDVALLYGQVLIPPELTKLENVEGVTPMLPIPARRRLNRREGFQVFGMGANFASRRSVFSKVGGFDEVLGGGGPLQSSQDFDFGYRVYRHGLTILLNPEVVVYHYGFRPSQDWPATVRSYGMGVGGFYFKHVRLGDTYAARLLMGVLLFESLRVIKRLAVMKSARTRWIYLRNVVAGMRASLRFAVDKEQMVYRLREARLPK